MLLAANHNNLFDTFFGDPWFHDPWLENWDAERAQKKLYGQNHTKVMRTDIKETDNGYELEMDLPGFEKGDIKAALENGYLIISAEKSIEENDKEKDTEKFICRERYTGSCQRAFYVGDEVEQSDIKASFKDGILHLDIPKKQPKPQVEDNKFISIEG